MSIQTAGLVGVECGHCHEEAFQLVEREVLMKVKVCPRCARRIDAERTEQDDAEALQMLDKAERKRLIKERSREWARSWMGKHVVVTYDVGDGRGMTIRVGCQVKGIAHDASNPENIGYGRVKVVLDEAELKRIEWWPEGRGTYSGEGPKDRTIPVIDGLRWGLGLHLISHGYNYVLERPLAFYINWGDRQAYVLEEFDREAEARAARREAKRLEQERLAEAARHLGEGI